MILSMFVCYAFMILKEKSNNFEYFDFKQVDQFMKVYLEEDKNVNKLLKYVLLKKKKLKLILLELCR